MLTCIATVFYQVALDDQNCTLALKNVSVGLCVQVGYNWYLHFDHFDNITYQANERQIKVVLSPLIIWMMVHLSGTTLNRHSPATP